MKNCHEMKMTYWAMPARTAKDLITHQPVSISDDATAWEAASFLIQGGLSIAPVINEAGRPVGVVSRTDILRSQMNQPSIYWDEDEDVAPWTWSEQGRYTEGAIVGTALVRDIMTPAVISVRLETPVEEVVRKLVGFELNHLFVVDEAGVLVGVISSLDILRSLCRCPG